MYDSFTSRDIVLGDAYYGTYYLLAELLERKVDAVFEQLGSRRRACDFSKGEELGVKDHIVTLIKPPKKPDWMDLEDYNKLPKSIRIREVKVGGKLLITTFLSPKEITRKQLKNFYKCRWHIELDIRNIKATMGMAEFSCKTPRMLIKEMWVYFLAYNLIRMLILTLRNNIVCSLVERYYSARLIGKKNKVLHRAYRNKPLTEAQKFENQ